jgi:hypothetical protein
VQRRVVRIDAAIQHGVHHLVAHGHRFVADAGTRDQRDQPQHGDDSSGSCHE